MIVRFYIIIQALVSFMVLYLLYPSGPLVRWVCKKKSQQAYGKVPIVLVHPALSNSATWMLYVLFLYKNGMDNIYNFEYSCGESKISAVSARLDVFCRKVCLLNNGKKPIVIGASLGGVIALRTKISSDFIEELITLACPFMGTNLVNFLPQKVFPLLHELQWQGDIAVKRGPPDMRCLYSKTDELIRPASSLLPPFSVKAVIDIGNISHMSIMLHVPTIKRVVQIIKEHQ